MVYQKQLVVVLAPAKLNLSLDVAGLLPNGYHDLDMVMQTIDLYERITLRRSADLTLRLPGSFVPPNDKNTAYKAAVAFFPLYRAAGRGGYHNPEACAGAGWYGGRQCGCCRCAGWPE